MAALRKNYYTDDHEDALVMWVEFIMEKDSYILGIETSCDETAAPIVKNGTEIISNVVASQIESQKRFGGVVPEIASRHHVEQITIVIEEALRRPIKPAGSRCSCCNRRSWTCWGTFNRC